MEQLTITQEGYIDLKNKIKDKLNETVNNFIIIGYYLKQIRDSGAYVTDGYHSIEDFAHGEYHLSKSTADRFMDINTMFSVDGNSLEIKEQYRTYGYSKLQEMLTMKPEDFELVTEDTTVKQMREIKSFEREENAEIAKQEEAELPLVVMSEEVQEAEENIRETEESIRELTALEQIAIAFWQEQSSELIATLENGLFTEDILAETINPSGSRTFSGRLAMLFFYDLHMGIKHRYIEDKKPKIDQLYYKDFLEVSIRLQQEGFIGNKKLVSDNENTAVTNKNIVSDNKESLATSQEEENAEQEHYEPLEGQTTVEDIGIMPDTNNNILPEKVEGEVIDEQQEEEELLNGVLGVVDRLDNKIIALTKEYENECNGNGVEWYRTEDVLKILKEIRG